MAIPDYQALMRPLLEYASDGKEHVVREATNTLAQQLGLTEEEKRQLLPSGKKLTFNDRINWAATYLRKAGLIESPIRGSIKITDRGLKVLDDVQGPLDVKTLKQFPEFREFVAYRKKPYNAEPPIEEKAPEVTPAEAMELGYQMLRDQLEAELLNRVKACSPEFFERLVVELLVRMGYGGSLYDAGQAIGKSGDGGIDGIIKEDKLGLDIIYIQAKKWDNGAVSGPEIQKFAGALQGQRARKGVFLTTSTFTKAAYDFVSKIETKIVLIEGKDLAKLMVDYNLGVSTVSAYEVKKMDSDYFEDET